MTCCWSSVADTQGLPGQTTNWRDTCNIGTQFRFSCRFNKISSRSLLVVQFTGFACFQSQQHMGTKNWNAWRESEIPYLKKKRGEESKRAEERWKKNRQIWQSEKHWYTHKSKRTTLFCTEHHTCIISERVFEMWALTSDKPRLQLIRQRRNTLSSFGYNIHVMRCVKHSALARGYLSVFFTFLLSYYKPNPYTYITYRVSR